jgi:hypothetical protein
MNKFKFGDIVFDPAEKESYKVIGVDHKKQIYSFAIDEDLEFASHFNVAHAKYTLTSKT